MEQDSKLTHQSASRYDRGRGSNMAETATAEMHGTIRKDVFESWKADLAQAKDADTRSAIMAAIELGVSKGEKSVDEMSEEEVRAKLAEIEKNENRRDRRQFEKEVDAYIEKVDNETTRTPVPGEVLRKKDNWAVFGWAEQDIAEVDAKLRTVFTGQDALDENQRKTIVEMLVATGQTPQEVLEKLVPVRLDDKPYKERNEERVRLFAQELHIRPDYVQRFIFPEEFRAQNEQDYQGTDPANIEELAWQIMYAYKYERWGPQGDFPLLEMRVVKDKAGNIDPEKSRYYINESNMVLWVRERMHAAIDLNPDDPQKFFQSINLVKQYREWSLINVFLNAGKYTVSEGTVTEDGKEKQLKYGDLEGQWVKEAWAMTTLRSWDVAYRGAMGDPKKIGETIQAIFQENTLFKQSFKKNLFSLMSTLSLNFEGRRENLLPKSDNLLGAAWMDIFMAYYNLSDFESLQKVLGKGSSFFTREGFMKAFKNPLKDKVEMTGERQSTTLDRENLELFEKAFDKDTGAVLSGNVDSFIKLVNFQRTKLPNTDIVLTVRQMFKNAVAEKYGSPVDKDGNVVDRDSKEFVGYAMVTNDGKKDEWSLYLAENTAWSLSRVFGAAARNDTNAAGYDFATKMHYNETYRKKQFRHGVGAGNPHTPSQFKMLLMDPLNAITTASFVERDKEGNKIPARQKTTLEVMMELQQLMTARHMEIRQLERELKTLPEGDEKARKEQVLEKRRRDLDQDYQNKAGELVFKDKALQNYYEDHFMRAQGIYEKLLGADDFDFEKFVHYDAFGGVRFDREEFQKQVQSGFLHSVRYLLNTYPDLNYNTPIRALDQASTIRLGHPVFRDMPMGEAMFGHELLNRPEFWKRKHGKPINMVDQNGRKMKGIYEIDYDKINTPDGKALLVKQWFMTKIAADLWSHREFHSTDPRFDVNYYNNVIKALAAIPSDIEDDEFSIRQQIIRKRFLDKKDMKWLKKAAKVENYNLFARSIIKDLLLPDEKEGGIGFFLLLQLMTREIVRREG